MLFHLVKKDFLIVKKYVLMMLIISIVFPLFLLGRIPQYAGILGFILPIIFAVFMLLQYVSLQEYQYPKAATLICAAPYPRSFLVLSRYVFCLVVYVLCCVVFWAETLVVPALGGFHYELPVWMFFMLAVFLGIYLPLQYKLGYEKTKFVFVVVIVASPFILPQFMKMSEEVNFDFLSTVSPELLYGGISLAGILILAVSVYLSIHFYNKADLA